MRIVAAAGASEWRPPAGRRWSEAEAREMVKAFAASGESNAEFAKRHGLKVERVRRWLRNLGEDDRKSAAPTFAPVRLVERVPERRGAVEVIVGTRVVRVGTGFSPDLLCEVIAALEKDAC